MVYSLKMFEDAWRCLNTWKRWDWYWIQRFGVHRISMNFYLRMFVSLKLWCEGLCSARFTRAWSKAVDFPDADAERLLQNACNTLILGARCQIQIADDSSGEILWWALILERCSVKAPWLVHRGSSTTSRRGSGFFGHGMPWLPWLPWPWHGFGHSVTGSGYIMIHLDVLSCRVVDVVVCRHQVGHLGLSEVRCGAENSTGIQAKSAKSMRSSCVVCLQKFYRGESPRSTSNSTCGTFRWHVCMLRSSTIHPSGST